MARARAVHLESSSLEPFLSQGLCSRGKFHFVCQRLDATGTVLVAFAWMGWCFSKGKVFFPHVSSLLQPSSVPSEASPLYFLGLEQATAMGTAAKSPIYQQQGQAE